MAPLASAVARAKLSATYVWSPKGTVASARSPPASTNESRKAVTLAASSAMCSVVRDHHDRETLLADVRGRLVPEHRDPDGWPGPLERPDVQRHGADRVVATVVGESLALPRLQHDVERLVEPLALVLGRHPEAVELVREVAGARAEVETAV